MLEPSLFLLLAKVIAIFLLAFATGSAICSDNILRDKPFVRFTVACVTGAAILNVSTVWAVLLGFPGKYGAISTLLLVAVRWILGMLKERRVPFGISRSALAPIIFLTSIAVGSYLLPFISQNTSGYYSRGGGDHSTYLSISDWSVDHSIKVKVNDLDQFPPRPNWEASQFIYAMQYGEEQHHPIANQLISTAYMSVLPGSVEETYTASVAFYVAMAAWSVLSLIMILIPELGSMKWPLRFVPLFMSAMLLYTATTHAIPFLFSISLLNTSLLLFLTLASSPVFSRVPHHLPLLFSSGALFSIYPHLFIVQLVILGLFIFIHFQHKKFMPLIFLGLISTFSSVLIANVLALRNIKLLIWGATLEVTNNYELSLSNILASLSGTIDVLAFSSKETTIQQWEWVGIAAFVIVAIVAIAALRKAEHYNRRSIVSILVLFAAIIVYYFTRGSSSYQMIRFVEIGHMYLLGLFASGLFFVLNQGPFLKITGNSALALILVALFIHRGATLKDTLSVKPVFGNEMRDAQALKIARYVRDRQSQENNRIVYYKGPGDGVDFAGAGVLFRKGYYLPASGNTLANWFDWKFPKTKTRIWEKKWLDSAFVVVRPESDAPDIIQDQRPSAAQAPIISSRYQNLYDTEKQDTAHVIGDAWDKPAQRFDWGNVNSFRYLRGREGALVIWSKRNAKVNIELSVFSVSDSWMMDISGDSIGLETLSYNVGRWRNNFDGHQKILISADLREGSNPIVITPRSAKKGRAAPWLIFMGIKITAND